MTGSHTPAAPKPRRQFSSSYQNYLFGQAGTAERPAWSDSAKGRAVIRMFSRGVMGAAFFTIGGRISRMQLRDYSPESYDKSKPLQVLAKTFDVVFGKPIAWMARNAASTRGLSAEAALLKQENAAWEAVNFRATSYNHSMPGKLDALGNPMNGRSLGAEMVSVSFDFAMMSVGDAMTRNFVQMIDPNIRKSWMVNDRGEQAKEGEKAHFSGTRFAQSLGKSAWRIITKNQGEDWAVALPYVYQMKWQRNMLAKALPLQERGAKIAFDHAWNGAAYKINNEGKIIGDYQMLGALDLHARFVGYNVLTLMFRESYDGIGHALTRWKESGYSLHVHPKLNENPILALGHGIGHTLRYILKSTIKANLYMNPAVIPFWLMRTPQTKWRGGMIANGVPVGENAVASKLLTAEEKAIAEASIHTSVAPNPTYNFSTVAKRVFPHEPGVPNPEKMLVGGKVVDNPMAAVESAYDNALYKGYDRTTAYDKAATATSQFLNPFGKACYWVGGKAANFVNKYVPEGKVKHFIGMNESNPHLSSAAGVETFMRNFVDASMAYTPYFYAKTEFGLRVDDRPKNGKLGKMDKAIYSMIDNVGRLKLGSAGDDMRHIWNLAVHPNRELVMRESSDEKRKAAAVKPAVAALAETPKTTIAPEGRVRDVINLGAAKQQQPATTNEADPERRWAESVAGRSLDGQFIAQENSARH